jgi:hypothetical protein
MDDEKQDVSRIEDSFVTYDPDRSVYERLHLCKYLMELPELTKSDVEKYKDR